MGRFVSWFPNVQYLAFGSFCNDDLEELHRMPPLQQLDLIGGGKSTTFTGARLMHLSRLTNLTSLRIREPDGVRDMSGDDLIASLCSTGLRQLRRLELLRCECLTDANLEFVLGIRRG